MAQHSETPSHEESEETSDDAEEQRTQPHQTLLWLEEHCGCARLRGKPKTYTEPAATPACEDKHAGTDITGGRRRGSLGGHSPSAGTASCPPQQSYAAPALLQGPTSAQAEVALLSTVVSPFVILTFLMDCLVVASSWTVNGEFVSKKIVSRKKERQTCPLMSDLLNIPPHMTGTRRGVGGFTYVWPFKS